MEKVHDFPYFEVEFTKAGALADPAQADALLAHVDGAEPADLLVLSHGWNNDIAEARRLYERLLGFLRQGIEGGVPPAAAGFAPSVFAVLWPSKKFADRDLIPGGAAAVAPGVTSADLEAQLEGLQDAFDTPGAEQRLARARELAPRLEGDPEAQREFVDALRALFPAPDEEAAAELPRETFELPGDEVLARLGTRPALPEPEIGDSGGAAVFAPGADAGELDAGQAMGLASLFSGIHAGARNFLNLLTYYTMKKRAGTVGAGGVHQLLRRLRQHRDDLRLHLVGHSFGGRLVTAAADGPAGEPGLPVDSMSLLQAAFSHYGFARDWDDAGADGFFRGVATGHKVRGPVVVTHTVNDRAVGLAYPIASRLARQVAAALGGPDDVYGGIGRNGALKTPEAVSGRLLAAGGEYAFEGGRFYNLDADAFITAHSDVARAETAHAILNAATA